MNYYTYIILCSDNKYYVGHTNNPELRLIRHSQKADLAITKTTYDAFSNPELEKVLQKMKIKNLILTGVYTAVCVDTTLRSAYGKGYNIVVPEDLVSMVKERLYQHKAAIDVWKIIFAYITKSKEIIKAWAK